MTPLVRLSPADLTNLATEAGDTPMHQAVLAALEGGDLLDSKGRVRIDMIRAHVEARLERLPELRRKLRRTHLLEGRPLWIDDPGFRIENHVLVATLPAPGGEVAALKFAERQMEKLMDRSRPLWEMWLLDGYASDTVGLLIKLHHAIADGPAMVKLLGQILDIEPVAAERPLGAWQPAAPPTAPQLLRDNLAHRAAALGRTFSRLHPLRAARSTADDVRASLEELRQARGAPRTSLNKAIGASRRIAALHISLADAKQVAHAEGVKLNDVFFYIVAGAMRKVLEARGEWRPGMALRFSMAVSRRSRTDTMTSGNEAGVMIVPVSLDAESPHRLLAEVAAATAQAKSTQLAEVARGLMVFLAETRITRLYIRHQHMLNVMTTNLPGPPVPLYLAGALVADAVALPPIAGNITVSFAALSYAGGLTLSLIADAASWPDLDVLTNGMRSSWDELHRAALPAKRETIGPASRLAAP